MTTAAVPLSLPQIEAQALAVLDRVSDAKVIAIQAKTKALWPDAITLSGRPFQVRWCESPLMAREALSTLDDAGDGQAAPGLILLTPLAARESQQPIGQRGFAGIPVVVLLAAVAPVGAPAELGDVVG